MDSQQRIASSELARYLQISLDTLYRWNRNGVLRACSKDSAEEYAFSTVNKKLAECSFNFNKLPTVEQFISGKLVLIKATDARKMIDSKDPKIIQRHIQQGTLEAIKIGHYLLVSHSSVERCGGKPPTTAGISPTDTARIIGLSLTHVANLVHTGRLQCLPLLYPPHPITRESLSSFVTQSLPLWIHPERWIEVCLKDRRPLLTLQELQRYLALNSVTVHHLIEKRRLMYIQPSEGQYRFAPSSADGILKSHPIDAKVIGHIFGIAESQALSWIKQGLFYCELHQHPNQALYLPCLIVLLQSYLTPGISARTWYDWRQQHSDITLWDKNQCLQTLNITDEAFHSHIQKGGLRGIRLPGTELEWRIIPPRKSL